jgi:2-oxoglutarate ferredoxin oxidoreductase subunit alpha
MFAKALFRMGIPVATRNIFPSNIQGLPTWFEVRVNERGYLGRREGGVDVMVAMNAETYAEDVASVTPGGYLFYDNSKPLAPSLRRSDIHEIGIRRSRRAAQHRVRGDHGHGVRPVQGQGRADSSEHQRA